jgi:hypothetical protein
MTGHEENLEEIASRVDFNRCDVRDYGAIARWYGAQM